METEHLSILRQQRGKIYYGDSLQNIYGNDAGFDDSEVKTYLWDKIDMVEDANEVIAPIFGMAHNKAEAWLYRSCRKR